MKLTKKGQDLLGLAIIFVFIAATFGYSYFKDRPKTEALEKGKAVTQGIIYHTSGESDLYTESAKIRYYVKGKRYDLNTALRITKYKLKIGDTVKIVYAKSNPKLAEVNPLKK